MRWICCAECCDVCCKAPQACCTAQTYMYPSPPSAPGLALRRRHPRLGSERRRHCPRGTPYPAGSERARSDRNFPEISRKISRIGLECAPQALRSGFPAQGSGALRGGARSCGIYCAQFLPTDRGGGGGGAAGSRPQDRKFCGGGARARQDVSDSRESRLDRAPQARQSPLVILNLATGLRRGEGPSPSSQWLTLQLLRGRWTLRDLGWIGWS